MNMNLTFRGLALTKSNPTTTTRLRKATSVRMQLLAPCFPRSPPH